jgi:hypothetical protein
MVARQHCGVDCRNRAIVKVQMKGAGAGRFASILLFRSETSGLKFVPNAWMCSEQICSFGCLVTRLKRSFISQLFKVRERKHRSCPHLRFSHFLLLLSWMRLVINGISVAI